VFDFCNPDSMPLSPVNKTKLFALYRKFQEPFFGDPKVREYIHSWCKVHRKTTKPFWEKSSSPKGGIQT
jgi:hypothetical protein